MDSYKGTGKDYMKDKIKGKKLISGYDSSLYKDLYNKTIP